MATTVTGNIVQIGAATAETWLPPTSTRPPIRWIYWTPTDAAKSITIKSGTTAGSGNTLFSYTSVAADADVLKAFEVIIEIPSTGINVAVTSGEPQAILMLQSGNV